ncbi:hypothetical protein [Amycolatopsis sp. NPDC049159]|uniref:hypothetical protein n=1 Tax=Amycolatopsis sp. NPDC049159 TaxID=3157210 RepID=UPI003406074D
MDHDRIGDGQFARKGVGAARDRKPTTAQRQINQLIPYLPEDAVDSIRRMRKMRDEVAHAQVEVGEAIAYAETAATLVNLIDYIERSTPSP